MSIAIAGHNPPIPIRPGIVIASPGPAAPTAMPRKKRPLGQILLEDRAVSQANLLKATVMRRRQNVPLGRILVAHGWVSEEALGRALSRQWHSSAVDPVLSPPDARLIDRFGPGNCLKRGILPWREIGGVTFIATSHPEEFEAQTSELSQTFGPVRMLICTESRIHEAIMALRSTVMTRQAEQSVPNAESCRGTRPTWVKMTGWIMLIGAALMAFLMPMSLLTGLTIWAVATLAATMLLKAMAFQAVLRQHAEEKAQRTALALLRQTPREMTDPLPVISVMVPLFHESDVAGRLLGRLARLDYPRELTDLLLVVEENDPITKAALQETSLPHWIRVVSVPAGPVQTKPRALNYALQFCRGDIVGIWDAEDRPDPDQLHKVARGFAFADPDVACLQGRLDYFNPRSNWLARCFTIEYAGWFRANLPGIARLGLVVPLGGTTLFFRRGVLEALGGWDAWNVTEDADLGVRLARHGWRTELIATTTDEEANCRILPWIKQRSRWLKGYVMTWSVHMRDPVLLYRQLGIGRFLAFQIQFFGTISQYLLAPLLWSFMLLTFGLPHFLPPPLAGVASSVVTGALTTLFIASELLSMAMYAWAVRGPKHRHLLPFIALMPLYFPLGCLAGWKAIYEVVVNPFYWDKTRHGVFEESEDENANGEGTATTIGTDPGSGAKPDPICHVPLLGDLGTQRRRDNPRPRPLPSDMAVDANRSAPCVPSMREAAPISLSR